MELCWVSHPCEMVSGQATVTTAPPPSSRGRQPLLHTVPSDRLSCRGNHNPVDSAQGWTLVNPLCPGLRPLTGPGSDCPGLLCDSGTRSPGLPPDRAGQFSHRCHSRFCLQLLFVVPYAGPLLGKARSLQGGRGCCSHPCRSGSALEDRAHRSGPGKKSLLNS